VPRARREPGGYDLRRLPKIVFRKLLRHGAEGMATHQLYSEVQPAPHPILEVDPRMKNRARLETIIHEAMHLAVPAMPEHVVLYAAKYIAKIVWSTGYRADEEAQDRKYAPDQE
jgi:hypothetical protein